MDYYRCWGCCSLRAGVITLGVLTLLGGVGDIIFGSIVVNTYTFCASYNCYHVDDWYAITSIVLGSLEVLMSCLLLIGVGKRKPNLLLPYCILMGFDAGAVFGIGIYLVASSYTYEGWWFGIWMIIWGCILCYFISVIRIYYVLESRQLLQERGQTAPYPNMFFSPGITQNVVVTQTGYVAPGYGIPSQPITHIYTPNSTQTAYLPPGTYPVQNANFGFGGNLQYMPYPTPGPYPQPQGVPSVYPQADGAAGTHSSQDAKSLPPPYS